MFLLSISSLVVYRNVHILPFFSCLYLLSTLTSSSSFTGFRLDEALLFPLVEVFFDLVDPSSFKFMCGKDKVRFRGGFLPSGVKSCFDDELPMFLIIT